MAEVGMNNVAGVDPTVMGIGPVPATKGLLERNGRDIDEYDLVELNEAFASQSLYSRDELGIDPDSFNANGGAIAIGHPLAHRVPARRSRSCLAPADFVSIS